MFSIIFFAPAGLFYFYIWNNPFLIRKVFGAVPLWVAVITEYLTYIGAITYILHFIATMVKAIINADNGGQPKLIESFRRADRICAAYIWVKILFVFKVICWSILFVIPGIVAGILYNFAGMALLVDGKRGQEALQHSKEIIKQNFFDYLFSTVMMLTVLMLICAAFILLFDNLILIFVLQKIYFSAMLIDLLEISIILLSGIYFLIFYYYLYKDLQKKTGEAGAVI